MTKSRIKPVHMACMAIAIAFAAITANATVIFDTLPSDDNAGLIADCGQTWMTGTLGVSNKLDTIEVATRESGAGGGDVYLAVYENNATSGSAASWIIGDLVAVSFNSQNMSVNNVTNTFEFNYGTLSNDTRYLYTFVNGSTVGEAVGVGVKLNSGTSEATVYSGGAEQWSGSHTIASRITMTDVVEEPEPYAWYKSDVGISTNDSGTVTNWLNQVADSAHDLDRRFGSPKTRAVHRSGGGTVDVIDLKNNAALWVASGDWGSLAGDRTLVMRARAKTADDNGFLFDGSTGTGQTRAQVRTNMWQVGVQPSGTSWNSASPDTAPVSVNTWQTHIFMFDETGGTTDVSHYIDGTLAASTNIAADTSLSGFILGSHGGRGAYLDCQISEIIVHGRLLDATERSEAVAYMDTRWGDLIDLPMAYDSAIVIQTNKTVTSFGTHGVALLEITSSGDLPTNSLVGLEYNLNGTTDIGDIEEVQFYDTGSSPYFFSGASTLVASKPAAAGTQTVALDIPIPDLKHHLWMAFKMRNTSAEGDILDAEITSLILDGYQSGTNYPSVAAPPESLTVDQNAFYSFTLRKEGDDGSGNFRIPGLTTTTNGTLIAAFDVRWDGNSISSPDLPGDIDVGIMRSTDGGLNWDPMQIIMDYDSSITNSASNGVGDPSILTDTVNGRIWCAALWSFGNNGWNGSGQGLETNETGQFVLNYSDDDGLTWTEPVSITPDIKDPDWRLYFQGPGKGICTREGVLVFPAQFKDADRDPFSNFIYSTDRGASWSNAPAAMSYNDAWYDGTLGTNGFPATTEAQIVELDSGDLLLSMRNHHYSDQRLWCIYGWDHETETIVDGAWGTPWFDVDDPTVMGSVERYRSTLDGHPWSGLLFSNPNSTNSRVNMTVHLSLDEGQSWEYKRKIDDLRAAYSCMTILPDGDIGLLYETGVYSSISRLVFARFPLEWIVGTDDFDGDGISDFDEDVLGLDKTDPTDAAKDPDGDGMSSLDESIAKTLPFDGASVFASGIEPVDGAVQVGWSTVPYLTYGVETSTNLVEGSGWVTVPGAESIQADSTVLAVDIPVDAEEPEKFYRAVLP